MIIIPTLVKTSTSIGGLIKFGVLLNRFGMAEIFGRSIPSNNEAILIKSNKKDVDFLNGFHSEQEKRYSN